MDTSRVTRPRRPGGARFIIGALLITAGVSSLLERAHLLDEVELSQWWPLVLIAIGLAKLAGGTEHRTGAWLFLGVGGWLLISAIASIAVGDTWPLLLLVWGGATVWRALGQHAEIGEHSHVN